MYNNFIYSAGADTPSAPWNQSDLEEKEFDVTCSQTLSKTSTVFTSNYTPGAVEAEREWDEDGYHTVYVRDPDDTSNVIWSEEWHDNDHYTPLQLIELFQKYLLDEVNGSCTVNKNNTYLNHLISECNNWTEDETEYFEE